MGCPAQVGVERILKSSSSTLQAWGVQHAVTSKPSPLVVLAPLQTWGVQHNPQALRLPGDVLAPLQTRGAQHSVCELGDESDVLAPLQTRGVQHWMCLSDCHLWEIGELQVKKSPRAFLNGSMHTSVFLVSQYGA